MKTLLFTLVGAMALSLSSAHAVTYILFGGMDPQQAGTNGGFGGGTGNGTGTISGFYDDVTNLLNYNIAFSNLTGTVTNMHFHVGAIGVAGSSIDLAIPDQVSPSVGSSVGLDAGEETNLLAGNWYVNIHTTDVGGGEIRGQVLVTPIPEPSRALLGLLGFLPIALRRRR